jgi:hypothetical protein
MRYTSFAAVDGYRARGALLPRTGHCGGRAARRIPESLPTREDLPEQTAREIRVAVRAPRRSGTTENVPVRRSGRGAERARAAAASAAIASLPSMCPRRTVLGTAMEHSKANNQSGRPRDEAMPADAQLHTAAWRSPRELADEGAYVVYGPSP